MVRERAGLKVEDLGAPMDVCGCGCRGGESDGGEALGRIAAGKMMVMLDRGDYWQCAYVIPKGAAEEIRAKGIEAFRQAIVSVAPQMHDRVQELRSFDDVKLLTVKVDRLAQWHRPGLLVHRRCGARDVAGRRRRREPRGAGRGGGGQPPGGAARAPAGQR